jgi:peptidoglycan/xylan/chitin deacetylase (PgdA/CDA1 family)
MTGGIAKTIKTIMGRVAGMTGVYAWDFRSKMTIVAFHRVNDEQAADGMTCSSAKFEAFCRFFQRHFRVISLSEQVAGCRARQDMGGTLSITFDDGYLDNFEVAAPILRKLHLPAAFFVTTGFIGSHALAPWDSDLLLQPSWMSWDHLRTLASQGFEVGCHTDTHIDMGSADPETVREELEISKRKLLDELGTPAQLFAYPFGGREHISARSRELVREAGFVCCISCFGGVNRQAANPYDLNRIGIADWFVTPDQFGLELVLDKA